MGRRRQIAPGAKSTTIYLTTQQHIALQRLQISRQEDGAEKPAFTKLVVEAIALLLRQEGVSQADLERIFPKEEPLPSVRVMPKRKIVS